MHGPGGRLVNLPKLSIAARLYAIFALMAPTTVALSMVAVSAARHHAALTDEFESANAGSWNVERINGLIYAMVMESRGIYMSADMAEAEITPMGFSSSPIRSPVIDDWQRSVRNDDALFTIFPSASTNSSIPSMTCADRTEVSPAEGRGEWADKDANRTSQGAEQGSGDS